MRCPNGQKVIGVLIASSALAILFLTHRLDLVSACLQIVLVLGFALAFGRVAKRLNQPSVIGEIFGGAFLGPAVLGSLAPDIQSSLFPETGEAAQIVSSVAYLGLISFVFLAGLEVNPDCINRRSRSKLVISIAGLILPFTLGFSMVIILPDLWGIPGDLRIFALFMGTALSISALPVIARILLDLGLLCEDIGGTIVTAATINDTIGWLLFSFILYIMNAQSSLGLSVGMTVGIFLLTAQMLYLRIKGDPPAAPRIVTMAIAILLISAASELLGFHAIFGVFMAGIVLSLRRDIKDLVLLRISPLVMGVLGPLYFGSIGLKVNFATNFDLTIILLVLMVASVGKVLGAGIGARATGMNSRESLAIGLGLNARGAMEIVLASAALEYGLIDQKIYVALVVMALTTTAITSFLLPRVLYGCPASRLP